MSGAVRDLVAVLAGQAREAFGALKASLGLGGDSPKVQAARGIVKKALAAKNVKAAGPAAPAPAPAPKKKPLAQATIDSGLSEHGKTAMRTLAGSLRAAKGILPEQKRAYFDIAQAVIKRMSPAAAERFTRHLKGAVFVADLSGIREGIAQISSNPDGVRASLSKVQGEVGGCYCNGHVVLDGSHSAASQARSGRNAVKTAAHVYAHEMAHAIDGPGHELSKSPDWQEAFTEELSKGKLNKYSSTKASEGWAEFGRLILAGEYGHEMVEKHFPKCWAVWKKHGLIQENQA